MTRMLARAHRARAAAARARRRAAGRRRHGAGQARHRLRRPTVPSVSRMELTTPGGLVREFTHQRQDARERHRRALPRGHRAVQPQGHALPLLRPQRAARRPVHVPAVHDAASCACPNKTRREPFLGSTFFVDDSIERPIDDYTYRFVGDETVGQRTCRLVEVKPIHPERELYGRVVVAIDPDRPGGHARPALRPRRQPASRCTPSRRSRRSTATGRRANR